MNARLQIRVSALAAAVGLVLVLSAPLAYAQDATATPDTSVSAEQTTADTGSTDTTITDTTTDTATADTTTTTDSSTDRTSSDSTTTTPPDTSSTNTPTLTTDKSDYAPGDTATIWGRFFAALQNVVLTIVGVATDGSTATSHTWGVAADTVGSFTTQYTLPGIYIPTYLLAASASTGEILAETSFTDGNVKTYAAPSGVTFTLKKTIYSGSTNCSTGAGTTNTATGVSSSGNTTGVGSNDSVKLEAAANSDQGGAFANWNSNESFTSINSTTICTPGFQSGSHDYFANYSAVVKTNPTVSVTNSPQIYTGSPIAATVTGSVAGTVSDVKYDGSGTAPTNVGTYAVTADLAPTDTTLYNSLNDASAGSFVINKADTTTTVSCPASVTYNGSAQTPCTATVTGPGGLSQSLTVTYSNNTNAGTATASASYGGSSNYNSSSGSTTFTINKADVTATAGSGSSVYDGSTHSPSACAVTGAYTGSLTCANDPASVGPDAGTTTISPVTSGADLANFTVTPVNGSYTITQAPSTVTVTCGGPYTYTGSAQTPCTAKATGVGMTDVDVTASLVYSNNINAGTATADASWGGDVNHTGSTGSGNFTIDKAPSITTTIGDGPFTYDGTTHTGGSGTVTGAGGLSTSATSLTYTGDQVNAGTYYVTAHYAGDANHTASDGSAVGIIIDKAPLTVTASSHTVTYGDATPTITPSYNGFVNSEDESVLDTAPTCSTTYTDTSPVSSSPYPTSCSGGVDNNYNFSYVGGEVSVEKADPTCAIGGYTGVYDGGAHGASGTCKGVSNETLAGLDLGLTFTDVPGGTAHWTFTDVTGNYNDDSDSVDIVITKAPSTVTVTCPASVTYTNSAQTPCTAIASGVGMADVNITSSISYSPDSIGPGVVTATATWGGDDNHFGNTGSYSFTIYSLAALDPSVVTAYNLVGTSHTLKVTVDPEASGIPVLFEIVTGSVNPQTYSTVTDSDGVASFTYNDTVGGIDTIKACVNLDNNTTCDGNASTVTQTKYWLTKFLTGGGNAKTGRGNSGEMWTFGGNVGLAGVNTPVGQFQVVDHNGSGYHFNKINSVKLLPDLQTFIFNATGWTDGSTKAPVTATITVYDGNIGGKNKKDSIGVQFTSPTYSALISTSTALTGGNLKVFVK